MYGQNQFLEMLGALGCAVTVFVLSFSLSLSFLSAIGRTLRRVSPENRRMEPARVWLNLIPVFNLVWAGVTVERVAESLRNEFLARGMDDPDEGYGRGCGLATVAFIVPGVWFYPAFVTLPIAFVCGVLYWRQLNDYVERLKPGAYIPPPMDEGW